MVNIIPQDHSFRRGFNWRNRTDWLIFHHVGPMPDSPVDASVIHGWHRERITRSGTYWNGIGYQAVILKDGTIQEGRPMKAQGGHTQGMNSVSIGVCVVGDFTQDSPTREQVLASIEFGQWARAEFNLEMKVGGHKTFANTACPGQLFPLNTIREEIKEGEPMSTTELTWQQKQTIAEIQKLADMGFLNNPEMWIEEVESGRQLPDVVYISLLSRIAQEIRGD